MKKIVEAILYQNDADKIETIRMLCMLPKEMLTMRLNDEHFEEPAEQWVERVDTKLIQEALARYDDPEFAVEREAMSCK